MRPFKVEIFKRDFQQASCSELFFSSFLEFFSNSQGHAVQRGVVQPPLLLCEVSCEFFFQIAVLNHSNFVIRDIAVSESFWDRSRHAFMPWRRNGELLFSCFKSLVFSFLLAAAETKKITARTPAMPPGVILATPVKAVPRLHGGVYDSGRNAGPKRDIHCVTSLAFLYFLYFLLYFTVVFDFFFDFFQVVGNLGETKVSSGIFCN